MQVVFVEVDDAAAPAIGDAGVADVPFRRHLPVEGLRARGHLMALERNEALEDVERAPHAVPRDAAADREHLGHCAEGGLGGRARPGFALELFEDHGESRSRGNERESDKPSVAAWRAASKSG